MNRPGHFPVVINEIVRVNAELQGSCLPIALHIGVAGYDKPHITFGKFGHDIRYFWGTFAFFSRHPFPGGGANEPVFQFHSIDFTIFEQYGHVFPLMG